MKLEEVLEYIPKEAFDLPRSGDSLAGILLNGMYKFEKEKTNSK